ncbi:unnamed protein product [Soboliphyme baturini]|uniref:HTH psq-type domain-containing protein n=1 Tax=Soboliphyme baturini TaxID=241478 RepID=A0A3P8BPZ0_9BILA|nr:unnamed protein product [Soboliphyme baturini]
MFYLSTSSNHVNKRNYSKADLEAAVLDIRSGKLGTRRASVIYGVPRSTLRNKIYKLEASNNRNDRKRHRTAEAAAETNYEHSSPPATQPVILSDYDKQVQVSGSSEHSRLTLQELTLNLAKAQAEMLHLDRDQEEKLKRDTDSHLSSVMNSECVSIMVQNASKIALIQMFEQKARDSISNMVDIIGDQQQQQQQQRGGSDDATKAAYKSCLGQAGVTESVCKKSRPKRGQYRKYDKSALAQAVQSVRRGEMSVHRAGSYYGVPHSTLEYKVKERNLIKSRKRQQSMSVDSNSSSDMQALVDDKSAGKHGLRLILS